MLPEFLRNRDVLLLFVAAPGITLVVAGIGRAIQFWWHNVTMDRALARTTRVTEGSTGDEGHPDVAVPMLFDWRGVLAASGAGLVATFASMDRHGDRVTFSLGFALAAAIAVSFCIFSAVEGMAEADEARSSVAAVFFATVVALFLTGLCAAWAFEVHFDALGERLAGAADE